MTSALLIRLGGLGDLLVALPALRLVRASFPDASLHLLARKEYGRLLLEAGVVNAVFAADDMKWMSLFDAGRSVPANAGGQARPPVPAEFRQESARYDWIAGWFNGRMRGEAMLGPSSRSGDGLPEGPGYRGGTGQGAGALSPCEFHYDPMSGIPLSRYFFERTADELGTVASFDDCRLLFPAASPRREPFAVVHPGSGSPRKCWSLDRFRRVIEALGERGLGGFLVSGEAEAGREADLAALPLPSGWRRLVRPPLSDLARLLRVATVYVGNDSGPTHLAAACGAETIAVFRDEFASAWAPFGRATVLSAPNVEEVAAEAVIAVLARVLDGAP
jgi:heptosyltransferase-3